jgi:hypothetical protein
VRTGADRGAVDREDQRRGGLEATDSQEVAGAEVERVVDEELRQALCALVDHGVLFYQVAEAAAAARRPESTQLARG